MIKTVTLTLVLFLALYFGTGGFLILQNDQTYEDLKATKVTESNKQDIVVGMQNIVDEQTAIEAIYPYILALPTVLSFLITSICFGIIGSIAKIVNDTIQSKKKITATVNLLLIPIQGGLIGIIILGISYALPVLLTNENISLKPISIVFLSLFGGVYYQNFYSRFLKIVNSIGSADKD